MVLAQTPGILSIWPRNCQFAVLTLRSYTTQQLLICTEMDLIWLPTDFSAGITNHLVASSLFKLPCKTKPAGR